MRIMILCFSVMTALVACAHQEAAPVVVTKISREPPRPLESPRASQRQEVAQQVLALDMMAGNIEPLQGDDPNLPDQVVNTSRGQVLEGSYKMCIATDGSVSSVTPVISIDGADRCVVDTLKTWRFPKLPLAVCKLQTLRFEIP